MQSARTDAASPRQASPLLARAYGFAAGALALILAAALWLRFGDGVYAQMLIDGIIACF